jgi:endonuclease I
MKIRRIKLVAFFLFNFLYSTVNGQYVVNFEGVGETKTAYASGTVSLSGLNWDMTEALIGTDASDWKNGVRSARMRGYNASSITMLQNKANGIGTITFYYRRYGTDTQVDWKVEYSTNDGANWTQIGSSFTAPASDIVQTFTETVNVTGNIRVRILRASSSTDANRRLNIDDITITDYTGGSQTVATPAFNPPAGTYSTTQNVSISTTTEGATIYYTTNGSDPDDNSAIYSSPIAVSSTTTIKAKAYKTGYDPSSVASATYTFPTEVANVSALRLGSTDGTVYKLTGEAILTYKQTFRNKKWIQDANAGIEIDDNSGIITTNYQIGDGITGITGTLYLNNNMLQFVPIADPGAATSAGNTPTVVTRTLATISSSDQGRLVKFENVTFDSQYFGNNFATGTNYTISDPSGSGVFRTEFYEANYIGQPVPTVTQNITTIVRQYLSTMQITARSTADFENYSTNPTINVNPTSLSGLNYLLGNGPSTSQFISVSGNDLSPSSGNIVVAGSTNYEVSLNNSTFSSSVQVAYTGSSLSSTNVYIRLKSGLSLGTYNETVTVSGGGASSVNVDVSGAVYEIVLGLPYSQDFNGFVYTLDNEIQLFGDYSEWSFNATGTSTDKYKYKGNWGTGTAGGFRGNSNVMGYQHTSSTGTIYATLTIPNNTGSTIQQLNISYKGMVERVAETRSPQWTVKLNGVEIPSLFYTTLNGVDEVKSVELTGLSIANGNSIVIEWSSTRGESTGSSKQIGIGQVTVSLPGQDIPNINVSISQLYNFGNVYNGKVSNVQFYYVSGTNINGNVQITAPSNFKVSTDCHSNFQSSLTLNASGGSIAQTRIYVRFYPTSVGSFSGSISHTSSGASSKSVNVSGSGVNSQIPTNYYISATGTGEDLLRQLHYTINNQTKLTYTSLWTHYQTTDPKYNGKVWDVYSDLQCQEPPYEFTFFEDQQGADPVPDEEGWVYNREHTWPVSWWGGSETDSMYTDINHIFPADRWVNMQRLNYPYGTVASPWWTSQNGGRLGNNSIGSVYSGTAFEPIDEYKGDHARVYFYMATRYLSRISGWAQYNNVGNIIDANQYPIFEPWFLEMLLNWHYNDPVSQKEIDRNNGVYSVQGNRNPYIDHPEFVALIWDPDNVEDGDVNSDGVLNVLDVVWLVRHLLGDTPSGFNVNAADVNGDTFVNTADLTTLINLILAGAKDLPSSIESEAVTLYLGSNGTVTCSSDGSIIALQFQLIGQQANEIIATLNLDTDHILATHINEEGNTLNGIIYSMSNSIIPQGEIALLDFSNTQMDTFSWGDVFAVNSFHQIVEIEATTYGNTSAFNEGSNLEVLIYPNPFKNTITIENTRKVKSIAISNLTGQILLEVESKGNEHVLLSTEKIPNGIYLITIQLNNGQRIVRKVVKQ